MLRLRHSAKYSGEQTADFMGAEGVQIELRADGVLNHIGDRFLIGCGHD